MNLVYGTIKNGNESLEYQVLIKDDIEDRSMKISESSKLIIDTINKEYGTNYPYTSTLNPVKIRKPDRKPLNQE